MTRTGKWPLDQLPDIATKLLALADEHRDVLDPRLPAGLLDHLRANIATLDGSRSAATRSRAEVKAATQSQNEAARAGYAFVVGVRKAVVRVGAKASEKKDFGVGMRIRPDSVAQIVAGLDAIIAATAKYPDLTRRAGILPADIEVARGRRTALAGADTAQATKKGTAKSATAARVAAQKATESDCDTLLATAEIAFHDDPDTLERFRDLVPTQGKKAKGKAGGGGGSSSPAT